MGDLRMHSIKRMLLVFVIASFSFLGRPAGATVIYDFTGTCGRTPDCGPLGVLTTTVTTVTGSLTLSIPASPIAQQWDATNVLAYSFAFGNFQITNTNSTLADSITGTKPFTTTATRPFSPGDGFLVATYNPDHSVFLNIDLGGVNLVQGSLTSCSGSCQALAPGSWSRQAVPEPATFFLLGSGLAVLRLMRRKVEN
jgi:PEP-CTERM motif-containing protein